MGIFPDHLSDLSSIEPELGAALEAFLNQLRLIRRDATAIAACAFWLLGRGAADRRPPSIKTDMRTAHRTRES